MSKRKVLVVDDEEGLRQLIEQNLTGRGYEVALASSGEEGLAKAVSERPDLIILDVEMPGMDGFYVCQEIRKTIFAPIILISPRREDTDVVLGLGLGADNYLTKPFNMPELLAYVDAGIRRETLYFHRRNEADCIKIQDLMLNQSAHDLKRGCTIIPLSPTEYKILHILARNQGCVLTRDQLLNSVWELDADGIFSRTVDVHIGRIRRKLGDDPEKQQYIQTVPGLGYKISND